MIFRYNAGTTKFRATGKKEDINNFDILLPKFFGSDEITYASTITPIERNEENIELIKESRIVPTCKKFHEDHSSGTGDESEKNPKKRRNDKFLRNEIHSASDSAEEHKGMYFGTSNEFKAL